MSFTGHLEFLRSAYADAHGRLSKSKAELDAFELHLDGLGLPKWEWRKQIFHFLIRLKREWERDLKTLLRLGRELRACEGSVAVAKVAKVEDLPAVQPEKKFSITYPQFVDVRVVDGKTVTKFDTDAAHWIKVNAWCLAKSFRRGLHFYDKQIPPEYAYVLEHSGFRYGPTEMVHIEYESSEFKRMCEREVEMQSEHALDGERIGYWRRQDREPLGPVEEEEKGSVSDEEEGSEEDSPSGSVD